MIYTKKAKITNKLGFHLRAVAIFVKEAEKYKSTIKVRHKDIEADGKSIMGLMTLIASEGSEIQIKAEGPDAKEAINNLVKIIQNKFGEPE